MAKCINFENSFQIRSYTYVNELYSSEEWIIKEIWTVNPNIIQKIVLIKKDFFESYYYADLQIDSPFQNCNVKIIKSERAASSNIQFLIYGNEYSCFEEYPVNANYLQEHKHRYKITLTPILQFTNEIFRRPGKRTKIDHLDGLKKLSNDISSLKDAEYYDIILCCGAKKVKAHKNVLAARSTLFKKFFHGAEEDEEIKKCLKIEWKTSDDDVNSDDDDDGGRSSILTDKKEDVEEKGSEIKNCIGAEVLFTEEGKDDQKVFEKETEFSNNDVISAMSIEENKIQNGLEIKERNFNNNDDSSAMSIKEIEEVQNGSKPKQDNDDSNNNIRTAMKSENKKLQNASLKKVHDNVEAMQTEESKKERNYVTKFFSNNNADNLAKCAEKEEDVQNGLKIQQEPVKNSKYDNDDTLAISTENKKDQNGSDLKKYCAEDSIDQDSDIIKVRLKNVSSSIFDDLIDFIYSGQYKTFDIQKAKDLLIAARIYGVYDLESKCTVYLKREISTRTCESIYNFASQIEYEELQYSVLDYIKLKVIGRRRRNMDIIPLTEEEKVRWMGIMRNHTAYLRGILKIKKNRKIKDELWGDVTVDCEECLRDILDRCVANLENAQN